MLSAWVMFLSFFPQGTELDNVRHALAIGEYRTALNRLSKLPVRDAQWHLLASRAWDELDDPAKAVAEAEEALKLDPRRPEYHVHLAQIFLSRHTPAAALEILSEADSQFPNVYVIRLGKGLAFKELQRYQDAERELQWCLGAEPASPLAFDALATLYVQQVRFDDAEKLSAGFLKRNASDYRGYYFLAAAREGKSLPADQTRTLLAESIARNPSFAAAYALMGKVLLREQKASDAIQFLKKAVELRPDLVQAHLHLARSFHSIGDDTSAAREFDIVRRLKIKEQEPVRSLQYHRRSP